MKPAQFDVAIIGAGINGAVSAAAAAAAGQRVLIIDRGDFAGFTSQESSNLVWGGIKYLQGYEFWLVFKLCLARNRLLRAYPNQIREIGFLASIGPTAPFGRLLGTLGTLFYWAIGLFGTNAPRSYSATRARSLQPNLLAGRPAVEYFDAELPDNDSRFVYDFVRKARIAGADARNYTELIAAEQVDDGWRLTLRSSAGESSVAARTLLNTAGPFASDVSRLLGSPTRAGLVFSKGVHFTLNRRLTARDQVLAFWDEESRLFYVLPMGDRSMIGTTDTRVANPNTVVTQEDIDFVLRQINAQLDLDRPITPDQIVSSRCGVRPLVVEAVAEGDESARADWHQLSRKHAVETNAELRVVTVLGGKLTDCLNVGQEVLSELARLGHLVRHPRRWFGEGPQSRRDEFFELVRGRVVAGEDADQIAQGLWRRHGEQAFEIIGDAALSDLFDGLGITEQELRYIAAHEQVQQREDLLRRRLPIAMARSPQELASNVRLQALLVELGL